MKKLLLILPIILSACTGNITETTQKDDPKPAPTRTQTGRNATTCKKVGFINQFSRATLEANRTNRADAAIWPCMTATVYKLEDKDIDRLAESEAYLKSLLSECFEIMTKAGREDRNALLQTSLEAVEFSDRHSAKCFPR